ncbi:hypothetical protein CASFOL_043036 [Castilleja foliolosa]|uniref:Acyltransferase n=1 Tax=Castilleja foliolosa TaxID=1961234 RepID=A0ABD3B718_9LAMI
MITTIVEQCHIAPSPGAPAHQILKLLHFDIQFLPFPPRTSLFFYNLKSSQSHFLNTIVPNFKNSLSLTLKHFPSMAGKIVVPSKSDNISIPISKYIFGQDYYPLTIAVSKSDFINTMQNHKHFPDLVPELPPATISDSSETEFSVAAIQLTLFPNEGVCVAFSLLHAIGDGPIAANFAHMLSSINRLNGRMDRILAEKDLPFYERDVIRDGDRIAVESWRYVKTIMRSLAGSSLSTNEVRATFVLSKEQMQMLKNVVPGRVSSFTVACAHLWTCLARSAAAAGEEVAADDEPKYLCFGADCRGRLDPPLPNAYFGNCLAFVVAESSNKKLIRGRDGLLAAVKAIKEAVQTAVGSQNEIMDSSLESFKQFTKKVGKKKMHLVAGSPSMDLYSVDFGWGRPIHIGDVHDRLGVSFLFKSRESEGGLEFGMSMEKVKMDKFAGFFYAMDKLRCKI